MGRTGLGELQDFLHGFGLTLEHRLHRSVGAVASPAGDAQFPRAPADRVAEEDALDAAVDQYPAADVFVAHRRRFCPIAAIPSATSRFAEGLMEALLLLLGLVIGAAVVALALRPRLRALTLEAQRLIGLERDLARAHSDLGHERAARRSGWPR